MNGFERHNIFHSSASAINMWADAPHMWVAKYLFGKSGKFGAAAKMGLLVEDAVVNVLARGIDAETAIATAEKEYTKFIAFGASEADTKRADAIRPMAEGALAALAEYGEPEFGRDVISGKLKQKEISLVCNGNGWTLPIIGFIDFHFPKHGLIVDLKTTLRMPSEMSASHHRQACIYQKSFGNQAVKFLYCTPKKTQFFDCGDMTERLAEIKSILSRQEKFLSLGDAEVLRGVVPVVSGSFYDDADITKELFEI